MFCAGVCYVAPVCGEREDSKMLALAGWGSVPDLKKTSFPPILFLFGVGEVSPLFCTSYCLHCC